MCVLSFERPINVLHMRGLVRLRSDSFSKVTGFRLLSSYEGKSTVTAQKIKFSIKDFFSKCDQIRKKLRIWSHLLKKSLMELQFLCSS